jgi:copper(I)-binding protein
VIAARVRGAGTVMLAVITCGLVACAGDASVRVDDAWSRAGGVPGGTGVVYASVVNATNDHVILTGVRVPPAIARSAVLHRGSIDGSGYARMRAVDAIRVGAGRTVRFAPGGNHIMLVGLRRPLRGGTTFTIHVTRRTGPALTAEVRVRRG